MQNSELYRRGIVRPRGPESEAALRSNRSEELHAVEHLSIETDSLFCELLETGLFDRVNETCGTLVDDYEECFVEPSELARLLLVIKSVERDHIKLSPDVGRFFAELCALVERAQKANTPVLFVL